MNVADPTQRYKDAQEHFSSGSTADALAILDKLNLEYPNEKNILYARARCLAALERNDEAILLAGQLVALGDPRGEQLRQSFAGSTTGMANGPKQRSIPKASTNRPLAWVAASIGAVVLIIATAFALRPHKESSSTDVSAIDTPEVETATSKGEPALTAGVAPTKSAQDDKWTWMNDVGPRTPRLPTPKKGEYDEKLCNVVRTIQVPHEKYPNGVCDIQIPTDEARRQYVEQTEFVRSPLKDVGIELALAADVVKDTTKYGYAYSTKPPAYVPKIGYDPNDTPIYYFAGQKVPGTDHWLIDTLPDGRTIPALTTIPFHWFRSINWPRERYGTGLIQARTHDPISGVQQATNRILDGVVRINGDYSLWERRSAEVRPGTLIAFEQNHDVSPVDVAPEVSTGRTAIYVDQGSMLRVIGTPQRPIIFTSGALNPKSADWASIIISKPTLIEEISYTLSEYGFWNWALNGEMTFENNLSRFTELPTAPPVGEGTFVGSGNPTVTHNEYHNHSISISILGELGKVNRNCFFNNRLDIMASHGPDVTKAVMCGWTTNRERCAIEQNIVEGMDWGVAAEVQPTQNVGIIGNLFLHCEDSVIINNYVPENRPRVRENAFFCNSRGIGVFYTGDTTLQFDPMEQRYDPDNEYLPQQPPFRNVLSYDFGV